MNTKTHHIRHSLAEALACWLLRAAAAEWWPVLALRAQHLTARAGGRPQTVCQQAPALTTLKPVVTFGASMGWWCAVVGAWMGHADRLGEGAQ